MAEAGRADEPVLAFRDLTYRYPGTAAAAVRDVRLEIEPGSFCVLAGGSGSGKSTLLRAACGLVPHFHGGELAGDVETGGLSVREHGPADLAAVCGTVLQDAESQVVMSGVRAEIALALEHRGDEPAAVARAVEEVALALGVAHLLDRRTQTLSGGELQRVALAAALAGRPALVLLDEPTSQLDPVAGDELIWLLRRLNEEWGTAVVVAEHRLERCLPAADRVIALDGGEVVHDGSPAAFLEWATAAAPDLATPLARLFSLAGLRPLPAQVKQAREALAAAGLAGARLCPQGCEGAPTGSESSTDGPPRSGGRRWPRRRGDGSAAALELRGVWHELDSGPALLRGVDLRVAPGELVALMGRNGAGKSTLLRHARGLLEPTRGRVEHAGEVALLTQSPGDYLVRDRAVDEAGPEALGAAGLAGLGERDPRDLSGGQRQRLALEVALGDREWACVCLDEPTRGMDRGWRAALLARVHRLADAGAAVVLATHDTELAAELDGRVVLMGEGVIVADGPAAEVLAGGWQFSTEVARVLGGAALTPEQGAAALAAPVPGGAPTRSAAPVAEEAPA